MMWTENTGKWSQCFDLKRKSCDSGIPEMAVFKAWVYNKSYNVVSSGMNMGLLVGDVVSGNMTVKN